jgi:Cu/Ag efflux pump CusA
LCRAERHGRRALSGPQSLFASIVPSFLTPATRGSARARKHAASGSQYGANVLAVTTGVDGALKDLNPVFQAEGIVVHPALFRASTFIHTAIHNIRDSLFLGGLLVAIVLALFLYNVRTAFISLTAIPLSLLIAVIVLSARGVTLNTLTLGGLAIAIGEVVDDAIIDVENIFRRLNENRARGNPRRAFDVILDASLEVRSAVVYATFVVALVFLPVLRMSGVQGRIFAPLGWAYILAIMASLAVALTVTPALCFVMLPRAKTRGETAFVRRLKAAHARLLAHQVRSQVHLAPGTYLEFTGSAAA